MGDSGSRQAGQWVRIQVQLKQGRVALARFQSLNCVPTVASANFLCGWAEGKTAEEAGAATPALILAELGEFPPNRRFCAVLAVDALRNALENAKENPL